MRILLSGGGTAGHINPAIAIAEILLRNRPGTAVAFVGTPGGMEERLLRAAGYPMYPVKAMGFSRSLSPRNLAAAWYALTSPRAARRILADFRPDAVIGTGGYVCYPILRAASGAGIPCALHESNAVPGLTVRKLAPRMDALWLNFAESADALPKTRARIVHTGNPMRAGFSTVSRAQARQEMGLSPDDFMVLSFGGSRGAEPINRAVQEAFPVLFGRIPELFWVHGCGTTHYDAFCAACHPEAFPRARVLPYLEKNAGLYGGGGPYHLPGGRHDALGGGAVRKVRHSDPFSVCGEQPSVQKCRAPCGGGGRPLPDGGRGKKGRADPADGAPVPRPRRARRRRGGYPRVCHAGRRTPDL